MHKLIQSLDISNDQKQLLEDYLALLIKWNKVYNLTAIKNYNEMVVKHILDSLSVKEYLSGESVLDVGTGAGLPGLVLAIVFPEKQFTLLDSNGKKVRFLTQTIHALGLKNCSAVQSRIEAFQPEKSFDCITTRAFAGLRKMLDLTQHLANEETQYLAMKGDISPDELEGVEGAVCYPLTVAALNEKRTLVSLSFKSRHSAA